MRNVLNELSECKFFLQMNVIWKKKKDNFENILPVDIKRNYLEKKK